MNEWKVYHTLTNQLNNDLIGIIQSYCISDKIKENYQMFNNSFITFIFLRNIPVVLSDRDKNIYMKFNDWTIFLSQRPREKKCFINRESVDHNEMIEYALKYVKKFNINQS